MSSVHIEFLRVQTWLFEVPRLRAMTGANTLLGEVLRFELPDLSRRAGSPWVLAGVAGRFANSDPDDPLADFDNPATDAAAGISSRDGGHFEAEFSSGAADFADAAASLLRRRLPGLRTRISVDGVVQQYGTARMSPELPILSRCEWTGRGLASVVVHQGDEKASVSLDVGGRHSAARRAQDAKARDIASLLTARSALARLETPQSFTDLAGDGYLALIHADGNGVGSGAMNGDVADRANFFHANRVLLRRAVAAAVARVCPQDGMAPLAILMLGGDDLLVACRADTAMRFVVELCDQLDIMQRARSGFQLTLGIGIVFSRPKVPVHRLHQVVEELTASAKTQFRALPEGATRSLVDWAVYSTAWVEGPMKARRRDWLRGTQHLRVLSQRPLPVLGEGLGALQGLLDASEQLRDASRSQLRTLAEQLFLGRQLAELYYRELSGTARKILQSVGLVGVWAEMGDVVSTPVLDLVEVSEIPRLGRTPRDDRPLMMTSREMEDAHVEA